jgi:hypothetical protein
MLTPDEELFNEVHSRVCIRTYSLRYMYVGISLVRVCVCVRVSSNHEMYTLFQSRCCMTQSNVSISWRM